MRFIKKRFILLLILSSLLLVASVIYLYQNYQTPKDIISLIQKVEAIGIDEEYIESFDAIITINDNGQLEITEAIEYNFQNTQRHGIYRDIPYSYNARGGKFKIDINVLKVTDGNSNDLSYQLSRKSGNLQIKIGEPDKYVTGLQTYRITYTANRIINYFDSHDELYWNVTGNNWPVVIDKAYATVFIPENSSYDSQCFTGFPGSTSEDCRINKPNSQTVSFESESSLGQNQGLTIVVGLRKGFLPPPSWLQKTFWILEDNFYLFLPLLVLVIMFCVWFNFGRDLGKKKAIIPIYNAPNNLNPTEVGALIDEKIQTKDITAILIYLAVKGYLKIKKINNNDWELIKQKDFLDLQDWQCGLMNEIFKHQETVKLSALKNKLAVQMTKISRHIYSSMTIAGFFKTSPSKIRGYFTTLSFIIFIMAFLPFISFLLLKVSIAVSAIIIFSFGLVMPRKTKLGTKVYQQIKGYKMYLSVAEKDRIKFHQNPNKSAVIFEEHLPYAMVLNVEKKWANKFKDIYLTQPSWYEGNFRAFNSLVFVSSLNNFNKTVTMVSGRSAATGSSGFSGGHSGGGFGGGGGGSW